MSERNQTRQASQGMQGGPRGPGGHGGRAPVQKAKNFKGSLKRLAGYLKPQKLKLLAVVLLAVCSVAFSVAGPKMLGSAINVLFDGVLSKQGVDFTGLASILVTVLAIYLVSALFGYLQQYTMANVSQRVVYRLRRDVDEKLSRLPLSYYDRNTRGDILSRITNDIDNISQSLTQSVTQLITSALTIVGVLVMMFVISPVLALISLVVLPVSMFVAMFIANYSQKQFKKQWASTGALNGHIEEMYSGHAVVKVFGRQKDAIKAFDEENERLYNASYRAQFVSGIVFPAMNFISNLNYVSICIIGGLRVASGTMALGDVTAFIQYSRQFTQPIMQTSSILNVLQSAVASAERVFELLDEVEEVKENSAVLARESITGHIAFEDISFRYKEDTPLIERLSFGVKPDETVAIVGPTGAGKTTLVNLLMRFYELNAGRITIDGSDITNYTRESLRGAIGMVLQDTWLFEGTIYDNIAYGVEQCTEEQVYKAAKMAYVNHFVRTLPDGYQTRLTDEAANISQGQRQLIAIARAFLTDPKILILDEATSSVDTRTEVMIQKAMARLMKNRTSFVIAHRLSTIHDADLILVMKDGNIIEQGNHKQLMAERGFYAQLYNSQFA